MLRPVVGSRESIAGPRARREGLWRGILFWALGFGCFGAGMLLQALLRTSEGETWLFPTLSFAGYLFCARKAVLAWKPDPDRLWRRGPGRFLSAVLMTIIAASSTAAAHAQQTIFNVPIADVLDRGKLYFEEDNLWRPSATRYATFTGRGVVGLGSDVEAGVNLGGFTTPGRAVPTATVAGKWRPYTNGPFALTAGAHALFFLRGAGDGTPGLHLYAHASYRLSTQTRLTAGGWLASSGYAAPDPVHGALLGLEQPFGAHLAVIADMYSGTSSLGFTTFGVEPTFGPWTVYAGYSMKNGDSRRNALLIELGVNP